MGVIIARAVTLYAGGADSGCVVGKQEVEQISNEKSACRNRSQKLLDVTPPMKRHFRPGLCRVKAVCDFEPSC